MNYEQLINRFAKKNNLEYVEAAQFIDGFFAVIKLGLAKGEPVKVYKLGVFSPEIIKTKLSKNKKSNQIEITPDEIYPHFVFTRAKEKKATASKKKDKKEAAKSPADISSLGPSDYVRLLEQYYRKVVIIFILFFIIFFLGIFAGYKYFKNMVPGYIDSYLNEQGLTHSAVEEMVNSKYKDIISKTEEYNQEISSTFSSQLKKIEDQQKASDRKVSQMEKQLKKKVTSMIQPQLRKYKKRAEVKMILYTVKKNDTLWWISKRYLKNPYNWIGLYHTNGKKIKNPDKIYPGQKIFIPVIKEY